MKDNGVGGFVAALLILPLVIVCCLGPVVIGSALGALIGWLGGLGPVAIAGGALVAGLAVYGLRRWRGAQGCRTELQQNASTKRG